MNNIEINLTWWLKIQFIDMYAKFDVKGKLIMCMYLYVIVWLIDCPFLSGEGQICYA